MKTHHEHQRVETRPNGTIRIVTVNSEPSMTQQQFADACDVNNIVKRHAKTGELSHLTNKKGIYADFSEITDYHDMLSKITHAQQGFMTLPADVRMRFRNDPGELLSFLQDPKNLEEAIKLGLVDSPAKTETPNNDAEIKSATKSVSKKTQSKVEPDSSDKE